MQQRIYRILDANAINTMSNRLDISKRVLGRRTVADPSQEIIALNFEILIVILRHPAGILPDQALDGPTSFHFGQ